MSERSYHGATSRSRGGGGGGGGGVSKHKALDFGITDISYPRQPPVIRIFTICAHFNFKKN